jgi:hypothetical protein
MSKFVVVKEAPATLEKGEMVINQPDFMDEIVANIKKAPKHGQTGVHHLREVLSAIGEKYDQDMNVFKINLSKYNGLPFKTNEDLSVILGNILRNEYPVVFDKYIEHQLKNRPVNTKLIYYVGNFASSGAFFKAGIDNLDPSDVESYMTGKPKKVVGKPAITNEEAEARGTKNA